MDLIKDESDVGQVVKVTYEDDVEFLNYNDVSRRVNVSDLTLKMLPALTYPFKINVELNILIMRYHGSFVIETSSSLSLILPSHFFS